MSTSCALQVRIQVFRAARFTLIPLFVADAAVVVVVALIL